VALVKVEWNVVPLHVGSRASAAASVVDAAQEAEASAVDVAPAVEACEEVAVVADTIGNGR
jgi:hypothetical protein